MANYRAREYPQTQTLLAIINFSKERTNIQLKQFMSLHVRDWLVARGNKCSYLGLTGLYTCL